ncbi:MAG: peptidyl-prolyl cis-trans isomerase [Sandaracinaceae bacterium]|nr:peptidyl-prolyl cis-trans isomerase [Sandaracinaceae bacterium]
MTPDRRGTWLLAAGALSGVALAAVSLVRGDASEALGDDVVAVVDGRAIPRERYERALEALATDRRGGTLRPNDRRAVLDRLVDEELLVSRAIELGLPVTDPEVRAGLVERVIDAVEAGVDDDATETELRRLYDEEPWRFAGSPRLEVEHAFFSEDVPDAEARARAAAGSDGPLEGDEGALPLPSGPLSMRTLTQRLGPTAARGVSELEVGATGGPWRARGGWHVARLVARRPGVTPPFEEVEPHVRAELLRARGEAALRDLLAERRRSSHVVLTSDP